MSAEVMTVDELAGYLNISESTLYKKVQAREIPFTKIGAALRFTKSSIDTWLARNTVQPDDSLFEQFARLQNRYHFKMWFEGRGIDWRQLTDEQLAEEAKKALKDLKEHPGDSL